MEIKHYCGLKLQHSDGAVGFKLLSEVLLITKKIKIKKTYKKPKPTKQIKNIYLQQEDTVFVCLFGAAATTSTSHTNNWCPV